MNEIILYKGLTILFAAGFGFLLLMFTLRLADNKRLTDSSSHQ